MEEVPCFWFLVAGCKTPVGSGIKGLKLTGNLKIETINHSG